MVLTGQRRRMMVVVMMEVMVMQMVGWFVAQKVVLADELVVAEHVQLFARAQLLAANAAREAIEMEHLVAGLSHQVGRSDTLAASAALGAVPSEYGFGIGFIQISVTEFLGKLNKKKKL